MRHTESKLIEPLSLLSDPYVHFIPKKKKKKHVGDERRICGKGSWAEWKNRGHGVKMHFLSFSTNNVWKNGASDWLKWLNTDKGRKRIWRCSSVRFPALLDRLSLHAFFVSYSLCVSFHLSREILLWVYLTISRYVFGRRAAYPFLFKGCIVYPRQFEYWNFSGTSLLFSAFVTSDEVKYIASTVKSIHITV